MTNLMTVPHVFRPVATLVVLASLVLFSLPVCYAGDWPQILGPTRTGKAAEDERLADSWPAGDPQVAWERNIGEGFAGVAVVNNKVVLFHREDGYETIEALAADTGKSLWDTSYSTKFSGGYSSDAGPRCVPVIDGDRVITFGAKGRLSCYQLSDGTEIWHRDTHEDFAAPDGYFGVGSSPIVVGHRVLVNVGGKESGIVAFDRVSGKTLWKQMDQQASYSSPVTAKLHGIDLAIFITRLKVTGINPRSGTSFFVDDFGARGPTVNAANPVVVGNHIFLTASYGIGAKLLRVGTDGSAKLVWEKQNLLSSQYITPILHDGALYGVDGRQDGPPGRLRALDPLSGKVHWTEENFGMASLIIADGKLVILTTAGGLVLSRATTDKYTELARASLFDGSVRALPALSNGMLYARDTRKLKCVRLARALAGR